MTTPPMTTMMIQVMEDVWTYVWDERLKERFPPSAEAVWGKVWDYVTAMLIEGYMQACGGVESLDSGSPKGVRPEKLACYD